MEGGGRKGTANVPNRREMEKEGQEEVHDGSNRLGSSKVAFEVWYDSCVEFWAAMLGVCERVVCWVCLNSCN